MQFPFKIKSDKAVDEYSLEEFQKGVILTVDKPLEWTSFQIVNKIKQSIRKKFKLKKIKIGHAGTLDPLATGLLIICIGKATKQIETFQNLQKTYSGTIQLGATTPSFDLETEINANFPTGHITRALIEKTSANFLGEIIQYPPIHSAVKINGIRAYKKARKGQDIKTRPRQVIIHQLTLQFNSDAMTIDFNVTCSKGTYIRSLANDLGTALTSGGHLTRLRREAIGKYFL